MITPSSSPGPDRQGSASQPDPGPVGPAGLPFNRRVHVVAAVLDRPEELDLLHQVCEAMGWPIREPLAEETAVTIGANWTLRVIEVRIRGVRETAVEQAVSTLDTLAQNAELSLYCRDATLVERVHQPQIEWHLRGRRGTVSRRIRHALHMAARTGEHDPHAGTVRLVRVPTELDEPRPRRLARTRRAARAEFAHHSLPLRRLDPEIHEVGIPSASRGWHVLAFLALVFTGTVICLLGAGLWPAIGADSPRVGAPLIVLTGSYLLGGTLLAVRRTPTHRALPWLVPLAVPLAVPLVPWLGALVQRAYLSPFGVRPAPGADGLGNIQAGLWVLCVFVASAVLPVAYLGWMRFLAPSLRVRGPWLSWAPALTLGIGMGMVFSVLILHTAVSTGAENRALAASGRDIPEYFGVSAEYACVEPTSREAPYYGTPPHHRGPVVIFGQSGDRVEFWDPAGRQKTSIRLEDARIRVVPHSDSACAEADR
ncbi:hypothetical protein [Streptomyces afghaniensis]|uniref:hypothetical protein n=1 Tax=Streptomyces afghaniensis TaxID=66865 RepID=UPI002784BA6B|nr:hypothetical protein [Streptomyces afghaniensis]MDQ1020145.1 hypothetical protein [Streptomyces afghaniensis]